MEKQSRTALRVLPSPEAIGEEMAHRILGDVERARREGRPFLLGCPTGRTPRPIYAAMTRLLSASQQDLSHLVLVMMDEYLVAGREGLEYAPSSEPWSCHHFVETEILAPWSAALPAARQLTADRIWFPDPRRPEAYDARIEAAGGIDFFLLASGAGDGHVAFNPPGTPRDSRTRIVELSEQTRRDNLQTFPAFRTIADVPRHGVSVGIATLTAARQAVMVVWGAGKRTTLSRMRTAEAYEADWPATVIHECAGGEILSDAAAAS